MLFFVLFLRCTLRCLSPAPRRGPECNLDWQHSETLLGGSAGLSPAVVSQPLLEEQDTGLLLLCWADGVEGHDFIATGGSKSLCRGPALAVEGLVSCAVLHKGEILFSV